MNTRNLKVKVSSLEESLTQFKTIWDKAERGEKIAKPIEIVSFESAVLLMKVLSPKRLELLQKLHTIGASSIRMLAKELNRDYSNVYQDVITLYQSGLVLKDKADKYFMPWNEISAEIPMTAVSTPVRKQLPKSRLTPSSIKKRAA